MERALALSKPVRCGCEFYLVDQSRFNPVFRIAAQGRTARYSCGRGCLRKSSHQVTAYSGCSPWRRRQTVKAKNLNVGEFIAQAQLESKVQHRDVRYEENGSDRETTGIPHDETVNRELVKECAGENGVAGMVNTTRKGARHTAKDEFEPAAPLPHEEHTPNRSSNTETIHNMKKKTVDTELARKRNVEQLVNETIKEGNKVFSYPKTISAGKEIELFLNRANSTLNNEAGVLISGAFNGWRWKSFTTKMNKTDLEGDWWSCHITVPRETYSIDFVFFNGKSIYENNNRGDFHMPIFSGMDAPAFEDLFLEEKHRELEKLAAEKADLERKLEQQRREEADKVAGEANRTRAIEETKEIRETLHKALKKALPSLDNIYYIKPSNFREKYSVRLYYNRNSGPLADSKDIFIHGGYNDWKEGPSIVSKLHKHSSKNDQEWWCAEFVVPAGALVLNWVFADGSLEGAKRYDNNRFHDFHAAVPLGMPEELYWKEEEENTYGRLERERKLREDSVRAKARKTETMKAEAKRRALRTYLLSQSHVVYTEPVEIKAGNDVTVYYNPDSNALKWKPEVWFRYSFNRWRHRKGTFPVQKMARRDGRPYVEATVKVPRDAYSMDFVFSDTETGAVFDNRQGMDYHIPVSGGILKEPPMHIVHVSVEMAPIAKVGGLGDVVTSLSRAVRDMNHNVEIVLPKYNCIDSGLVKSMEFKRCFSMGGTEVKVWFGEVEGIPVYFLEPQNGFFGTGCVYGGRSDEERFGFFCRAALEFLHVSGVDPDIIHCHDWSSAPVAWLRREERYAGGRARVVFTIHNLEFGAPFVSRAMAFADRATTVSPTYSLEVSGNPAVAPHLFKFRGVLNGIDGDMWDPYNDRWIPVAYTRENVVEGKRAAKEALQRRLGLGSRDAPVVGIVTRLTHQKGIHLIKHAVWRTLDRGGQVVLLGSAPDPRIQGDFVSMASELHSSPCADRARLCLTYDEPLSHLIYAGADFILVPSIFEPCGLTQLIAMRYGSIPIVRKTGGLYDTVFDVENDKERARGRGVEPNGFSFDGTDAGSVDYALNRAISTWYENRKRFDSLCGEVMEQDWSWNRPALDYMDLYYAASK